VLSGLFVVFVGYIGIANFGGKAPGEPPVQQVVVAEEDLPVFSFYQELAHTGVGVTNTPGAARGTTTAATTSAPAAQSAATPPATASGGTAANAASAATATASTTPATAATVTPASTTGAATTAATGTAPSSAVATKSATASTDMRQYLLQAGSFQNRQEAENRRARIVLLNLSANVVPGVVAGRTWQRVQVGPFNGRQSADDARAVLSANNIESIPLIVR
jgi:cell division protein FtsN